MNTGLEQLEAIVARDLKMIAYPESAWVPARSHDGQDVLDVLVVGAGQGGIAVAAHLRKERIERILVVDHAPRGAEGPWLSYARMHTLRTAKFVTGPDMGIPSLTFQAWYEAINGEGSFTGLFKIAKEDWSAYLLWLRDVLDLPVKNSTTLKKIEPVEDSGVLQIELQTPEGLQTIYTRKLVLAHGIEASGRWWMPPEIAALPGDRRAHTAHDIDFESLRGQRVAVIGAGASAFDNAAVALEHGAKSVTLLCRRPELQRVQPYKVIATPGFLGHFGDQSDERRWRVMQHLLSVREALTLETWTRVTIHDAFSLMTGAPVLSAKMIGNEVALETPAGTVAVDFVICGTGLDMALDSRPELEAVARHAAVWGDRYQPEVPDARMGRFPYVDGGFAFVEKTPGTAPWLSRVHCFNFGATLSMGPSGSSISGMKYAVPRLVRAIMSDLFTEDFDEHLNTIEGYALPEFPLTFARDSEKTGV